MNDTNLALLVAAAGYGINILVLGIIAVIIWGVTKLAEINKTN